MKKKSITQSPLTTVHIVQNEFLNPYNPVSINLIGAGGTGSQMLTALARMSQALNGLNHPGFVVTLFDDDTVQSPNLARQLFYEILWHKRLPGSYGFPGSSNGNDIFSKGGHL